MANKTIDGGTVLLYIDDVAMAYSTGASLSLSDSLRESPHKDDARWTERAIGRLDVTGSCNMWVAFTDGAAAAVQNVADIWPLVLAGTEVTLKFSNSDAGDYEWSGPAIIEGLNMSYGNLGETAEGDFSFMSNGAWTQAIIV